MFNGTWEVAQDELVQRLLSAVNYFVQHFYDEVSWWDLGGAHELVELISDVSSSLMLSFDAFFDVKVDKTVLRGQLRGNLLSELCVGTGPDMDDKRLNASVDLVHCLVHCLVGIDFLKT